MKKYLKFKIMIYYLTLQIKNTMISNPLKSKVKQNQLDCYGKGLQKTVKKIQFLLKNLKRCNRNTINS